VLLPGSGCLFAGHSYGSPPFALDKVVLEKPRHSSTI